MMSINNLAIDCPILIGGAPSSGSTLLSVMLDAHPDIFCGPELGLMAHSAMYDRNFKQFAQKFLSRLNPCQWAKNNALRNYSDGMCPYALIDEGNLPAYGHSLVGVRALLESSASTEEFIASLFATVKKEHRKNIVAEKTPSNVYAIESFLEYFREGRAIYLIRDPRAVVASLVRRGFGLHRAISIWLIEAGICYRLSNHPRIIQVRYEDLVLNTAAELSRICAFLKVEPAIESMMAYSEQSHRVAQDQTLKALDSWRANPTQPVSDSSLNAWQSELSSADLAIMTTATIFDVPEGLGWLIGTKLPKLADFFGYEWHDTEVPFDTIVQRLLSQEMVAVPNRLFDVHYFHERFIEFDIQEGLDDDNRILWQSIVTGVANSYVKDSDMLNELVELRDGCCQWYEQYTHTNNLLQQMALEKDSLTRQVAAQVEQLQQADLELQSYRNQSDGAAKD